jgi:hypothetical protein
MLGFFWVVCAAVVPGIAVLKIASKASDNRFLKVERISSPPSQQRLVKAPLDLVAEITRDFTRSEIRAEDYEDYQE